jgi:hypothetical protein
MDAQRFRVSTRTFVWAALVLILGAATAGAGWLLAPLIDSQRAAEQGNLPDALTHLTAAEARLDAVPFGRRLLPGLYDQISGNALAAMYGLHQYDQVIDKAGASSAPSAQFWAGCALFVKSDTEVSERNRLNWMLEAQQAFRAAMEADRSDFDARFNYELVGRVIAGMKKDPTTERPTDLQLLTPSSAQAPRKIS